MMRVAYLDCFAGISGDMLLGALIDAGLEVSVLHDAAAALGIGASLRIERVDRSGISATKVHVLEAGRLAEAPETAMYDLASRAGDAFQDQLVREDEPLQQEPKTQHMHKDGHPHPQGLAIEAEPEQAVAEGALSPGHQHGRSLTVIRQLIAESELASSVKDFAIRTFNLLGASEARIHNVPVDQIHFHEVGAVDAIMDIVLASAGIQHLNSKAMAMTGEPLQWHSSPLNVGGGMVDCAHGRFPVPAPATADLLRGMPTYSAHLKKELVTPTGAAILKALSPSFGDQPAMRVESIGYGAGTRNPENFPNVLRLSLGEASSPQSRATKPGAGLLSEPSGVAGTVTVIETAIDDMSPQILAHVTERALLLGALDVMCTAVQMKKGRIGTLITILSDEEHTQALKELLLRETSTLGIRLRTESRVCLERTHKTVQTQFGEIRVKVGSLDGQELNAAPEFEDCRSAAEEHGVPVKRVLQATIAAYAAMRGLA